MSKNNLQVLFLDKCRERNTDINIAQDLSELLGLTIDSVYRRLRGETSLTFVEIMKICHHYKISYDAAINFKSKYVPFQFNTMFREKFEIVNYLKGLSTDLESMRMDPNIRIVMTAMDLPYFRQFGFKSLSRFKLFFWQRSVLNLPYYRHMKFDWKTKIEEFEDITEEIYIKYHAIPSVEIWAPETLDSTLKQIKYYYESGLFKSLESAHQICDDLEKLYDKLEEEAERGKKRIKSSNGILESDFSMYQSDIYLSNNSIQAYRGDTIYTYISFNSFNTLMSYAPEFSTECEKWIDQIRSKSILLSEVSEKLRYQFFLTLRNKIADLRESLV